MPVFDTEYRWPVSMPVLHTRPSRVKGSLLLTSILVLGLAATGLSGCATRPRSGPELSVSGPVLFRPEPDDVIYVVDFPVTLKGPGRTQTTRTDLLGQYRFRDVAPGTYTVCWEQVGWEGGCTRSVEVTAGNSAYPGVIRLEPHATDSVAWGDVRLADGSSPVLIDRGSGTEQVPSVEVLDAAGKLVGAGRINAEGKYAIGVSGVAATIRVAVGAPGYELLTAIEASKGATHVRLRNHSPRITQVAILKNDVQISRVNPGDVLTLRPTTTDADGDHLSYHWSTAAGTITSAGDGTASWRLPNFPARLSAYLLVTDDKGGADRRIVSLRVGALQAKVAIEAAGAPPSCGPLSLAHVPAPSGYPPGPPYFLSRMGTTDNSAAYYQNVDPNNLRDTLGAWWSVAGFDPSDGSGGVAQAAYLNWNDLGFGRDMHFNKNPATGNVYAWVTNYGCPDDNPNNADLAAKPDPADAVATVCMEYSPVEGASQPPIVKFFVYAGGVAAGTRLGAADLDEWGGKPVPNLCQNCHGGTSPYEGGTNVNLAANFLPFDLALLQYPGPSTTPPPVDLGEYYTMNAIIAQVTTPTTAISDLINGWYDPLKSPPTQNNNYIPTGWQVGGSVPASAAGLYQNVIVPGCRACHYSFSNNINWDSYQSALTAYTTIDAYACGPQPIMPHAAVTYINFWTNAYGFPVSPPTYLGQYTDPNWEALGGCLYSFGNYDVNSGKGFAGLDEGHSTMFRGMADVSGDGRADYCRFVGDSPDIFLSCALSTGITFGNYDFNSGKGVAGLDPGYSHRPIAMVDVNADGRADYCRFVGSPPDVFLSCALSTGSTFGNYDVNSGKGFAGLDEGHSTMFRGMADVNGDGRADYCRFVGDSPEIFLSCALSTGTTFGNYDFNSGKGVTNLDPGYSDRLTSIADVADSGRAGYCRFVGSSPEIFLSCALPERGSP